MDRYSWHRVSSCSSSLCTTLAFFFTCKSFAFTTTKTSIHDDDDDDDDDCVGQYGQAKNTHCPSNHDLLGHGFVFVVVVV
jgi:hypothetical protein